MKTKLASALAGCLIGSPFVSAQVPVASQSPVEMTAPDIAGVVAGGTPVQLVRDGFESTEGPIGAPDGSLLFTEGGAKRITKIDRAGNVSTYLDDPNGSNGLAFDSRGRLIAVQTVKPQVGVIAPTRAVLVDAFEGQPLMRPNDLVVDRKDGVYFTDPGAPLRPGQTHPRKPAVFYIGPDGRLMKVAEDIGRPNGIQLSPDEKVLYVADSYGEFLLAFDTQPDSTLRNRRQFARLEGASATEPGTRNAANADGLAVDRLGRLYVATVPGVQVFSPQGEHLGTIRVPVRSQNLAFAGPDRKTLYVVASGAVYKIAMQAEGLKDRAK